MNITKTSTQTSIYDTFEENYKIDATSIDLHILVQAIQSYCHGGYTGENLNHLEAANKLRDALIAAWVSPADITINL